MRSLWRGLREDRKVPPIEYTFRPRFWRWRCIVHFPDILVLECRSVREMVVLCYYKSKFQNSLYCESRPPSIKVVDLGVQGRSNTVDVEVGGWIYQLRHGLKVADDMTTSRVKAAVVWICTRIDLQTQSDISRLEVITTQNYHKKNIFVRKRETIYSDSEKNKVTHPNRWR